MALAILLVAGLFAGSLAWAEKYPVRAVTLVVPLTAGSLVDQVGRLLASRLQEAFGQPFLVENKIGAQGSVAAAAVAKAVPDGYTLMLTTNATHAANVSLFKMLRYDPVRDFSPIARIGTIPFMLMVRPDFPTPDLKGFLAHARAAKGLSAGYGSSGPQVAIALLSSMGQLEVLAVPYRGTPQAIADTMGGSVSFTIIDLGNALLYAGRGQLRALAVTSAKRTALAPDVPALAEELPGYELLAWAGLVAPANAPHDVMQRLHDATVKAMAVPEMSGRLAALGIDVAPLSPPQFARFIQSEIAHWAKLAKLAGIEAQ